MKKPIFILIIRRHSGELDWILPLLYKFKNKYRIISIFSNKDAYESVQRNLSLFNIWHEISKEYFVITKKSNLLWKIMLHIISKFNFNHISLFYKLNKFLKEKVFDVDHFLSIFNIKITDIKAIFITTTHLTSLPSTFKKKNSKILLIRYPESSMIIASKKENFKILRPLIYRRVIGDLFLFTSKANKDFFLGDQNSRFYKKSIYYSSVPRYEDWWLKKFVNTKKNNDKSFRILVLLRSPNSTYFQRSSFHETINSIMKLASEYNDCKIIFKTHPSDRDITMLKSSLSKFSKDKWEIRDEHAMTLAVMSNFCISIITSACLDSLALKVPTVEYYMIKKEIEMSHKAKSCVHIVFNSSKKKWQTIFNYKELVNTVSSYNELKKYFLMVYLNKKSRSWNKSFHNFKRINQQGHSTNSLYKIISKKIDKS